MVAPSGRNPKSWVQLEPAIGTELIFPGYISDKEVLGGYYLVDVDSLERAQQLRELLRLTMLVTLRAQ